MKKLNWKTYVAGVVTGAVIASGITFAFADSSVIKLIVNGKQVQSDVPPQIINGRTMAPIRAVAEAMGAQVQWDGTNRAVVITSNNGGTQASYTPPTSIASVIISDDGAGPILYVPQSSETQSISQQILSWLQSATTTTIDLPPSTPGLSLKGYVGPSSLYITMADKSQITIYPAYTITAVGNQGGFQVNYEPNVVAYVEGNQTIYLNSPQLYTWLKNDQWKTKFTAKTS